MAAHIADFTPRLRSHTMARYPYVAIPAIRYPQLEKELFCNVFYLRHLCDTVKFPDWPIPEPVSNKFIFLYDTGRYHHFTKTFNQCT